MPIFFWGISLLLSSVFFPIFSEKINVIGSIQNGTTGTTGRADKLKLFALQGGMVPIGEKEGVSGNFIFEAVEAPEGVPLLLQAQYLGASYNQMIPPTPQFRSRNQVVWVYDRTEDINVLDIRSLVQIVKDKDSMRVFKIYILQNTSNPPKSFLSPNYPIEVYIPSSATELTAQLTQGESKMGIPLFLTDGKNGGKQMERAVLPGQSELQVSYTLPGDTTDDFSFEDKLIFESKSKTRPIFLRPKDMELKAVGLDKAQRLDKDIPDGLNAYLLDYGSDGKIEIILSGGQPVAIQGPNVKRDIVNGTWIPTWDLSLFAVIGFLGFLLTLSVFWIYPKS